MTDAIQKRLRKATERDWNGEKVWLRKLGADQALAFIKAIAANKDKTLTADQERDSVADMHARNIAKSFCDKDGNLTYDTDERITQLKQLPFDELVSLGDLVLEHAGFGSGEKKSTQPTNLPHTDCALDSASSTPITSSPA